MKYIRKTARYNGKKYEAAGKTELEAMTRTVRETFAAYYTCFPKVGKAVADQIEGEMPLGEMLDCITVNTPFSVEDKQKHPLPEGNGKQ